MEGRELNVRNAAAIKPPTASKCFLGIMEILRIRSWLLNYRQDYFLDQRKTKKKLLLMVFKRKKSWKSYNKIFNA